MLSSSLPIFFFFLSYSLGVCGAEGGIGLCESARREVEISVILRNEGGDVVEKGRC